MVDLNPVVEELRVQLDEYLVSDRFTRGYFTPTLSDDAKTRVRAYVEQKPALEEHLDDFCVNDLGPDIADSLNEVERFLVLKARCPLFERMISTSEVDVAKSIGVRKYLNLVADPTISLSEKYDPFCTLCKLEETPRHPLLYSYTRFASMTVNELCRSAGTLAELSTMWELQRKMLLQAEKTREFLESPLTETELEAVTKEVRLASAITPTLGNVDLQTVDLQIELYQRLTAAMSQTIDNMTANVGKPLAAVTLRIRRDPMKRILYSVILGRSLKDSFNVRAFLGSEKGVPTYSYTLAQRLLGLEHLEIETRPEAFVYGHTKGMQIHLTYRTPTNGCVPISLQILPQEALFEQARISNDRMAAVHATVRNFDDDQYHGMENALHDAMPQR